MARHPVPNIAPSPDRSEWDTFFASAMIKTRINVVKVKSVNNGVKILRRFGEAAGRSTRECE
jgi:hypothetical protein